MIEPGNLHWLDLSEGQDVSQQNHATAEREFFKDRSLAIINR
jgi:hypothetical protein